MSNSVVKLLQNILITDHKCEGVIPLECSVFPTKVIKIVQPGSIPVTIVTPGAGCGTCPAVHTALHCPTPTLSLSQFSGVFEMLRYYSEHSYHTASHYSHTWYTSWWLVSCQSPSHYINHVHTSHHAIYWQPESLELIIKMIPAFSAVLQEEEARDKMRVQQAASVVFWAQTPCEDHQSDSNGYLIFLYGNRFQFTANAIIDLV